MFLYGWFNLFVWMVLFCMVGFCINGSFRSFCFFIFLFVSFSLVLIYLIVMYGQFFLPQDAHYNKVCILKFIAASRKRHNFFSHCREHLTLEI